MAVADQVRHVAVEERQEKGANVRAVNVGVRHDDHAVVAEALRVIVFSEPRAQRCNQCRDLLVGQHAFRARLLDVQDLASERQDGLELPVPALLGRPAGRLALDDVQLAACRVFLRAVGQFARE